MAIPNLSPAPCPSVDFDALRRGLTSHPEIHLVSAYLFGSHAEGRAHRESDVDVAVLLDRDFHPTPAQRFAARVRLGSELIATLHQNAVDVVILNDAPPLFARRILWEGRRILLTDAESDRIFLRDIQLRAADLQPFLARMQRIKLKALAG